ncbi:uncharacterized protein DUF3501 [Panacagrimonas perspica]|uniref:Uncharacterized protein DUF3501 n=1 Tax=Panacagrimonas perspica TaxID=381431 RepID=A0A4S3KAF0_9GAMM|nr:DUF3501 family protein [Panacagrimonas perspica]TDU32374.1 uncharacterized protein DUF3501 [Panacagrimonas perspica]THD05307.1 hypothetical protein B1810_00725 [Panacagrimonas perspica]
MNKLTPQDLWKLEEYAEQRPAFRKKVIAHKKPRKIHLGEHLTLIFEDRLTIQYQVQEMLRIERIFERAAIQEELDSYNPLIPDGSNWKATLLVEYEDVVVRQRMLSELRGLERCLWLQVGDLPRVIAIADEDLERQNEEKTSAVHFLRFELTAEDIRLLSENRELRFGTSHPKAVFQQLASDETRRALLADLA